jgi:hypothetical protein
MGELGKYPQAFSGEDSSQGLQKNLCISNTGDLFWLYIP